MFRLELNLKNLDCQLFDDISIYHLVMQSHLERYSRGAVEEPVRKLYNYLSFVVMDNLIRSLGNESDCRAHYLKITCEK